MSGLPNNVSVQSENTVTLKLDGGQDVIGELIEFSDNMLRVETLIGVISVPAENVECIGAACPEGTRAETSERSLKLTARDGSITLVGDLVAIIDGQYVLETDFGQINIEVSRVDCEGNGCVVDEAVPEFGGEVVLTGAAGALEGILIEIQDDAYIIETPSLGVVRISKEAYECSGVGCP